MDNKWGLLVLAGIVLLLFVTRKNTVQTEYTEPQYTGPLRLRSVAPAPLHLSPAPVMAENTNERRYRDTETWDIKWDDGLPTQITIHRDAVQT